MSGVIMSALHRSVAAAAFLLATPALSATIEQGLFRGQAVTYVRDGSRLIYEGDILLDHVTPWPTHVSGVRSESIGIAYPQYLWPANAKGVAQIPYVVASAGTNLNAAIASFNKTLAGVIQFVPRAGQSDYVSFDFDNNNFSGQCESNVGRIGGEQVTGGSGSCTVATILHEMGHIVGLYHEQSRPDRATYLTVDFNNVIKGSEGNFAVPADNFQDLGPFDYASVMAYIPFAFSRNGGPVLETIPPGMPLSNQTGYTAADIDGIKRLYGFFPNSITVTSNPVGLSVIVDGATVTTPKVFSWTLKSTHTLAVSPAAQTITSNGQSFAYTYGRWSDNTAASHSITVSPGNNTATQPLTRPAVTVYTANFIQLSPYSTSINTPGAGTVSVSPSPQSYPGVTGEFLVARQPVTLTASAVAPYQFVTWGGTSAPYSANPKADYVPDGAVPYSVGAAFSMEPVTTIATNPGGFYFTVDGEYFKSPQSFTADTFSGWGAQSTHVLTGFSPNLPYSVNTQYLFDSWSDGGALSHTITIPAGASTITGSFTAQYVPIVYANPACAATVTLAPASSTGFYSAGTKVKVTATGESGWTLTNWSGDLSTRQTSQNLTVSDEELAVANYNTSTTGFRLTSLTPASMTKGGMGGTVTIHGTGFTGASQAYVNGLYRPSTYVSESEIQVTLTKSDLTAAGAVPIGVANFPSGSSCSTYSALGLFILR
jgi:astacin